MGIIHEGAFSQKVGSKLRLDRGEKEVPTEGEPLKPRFDRGEIAKNRTYISPILVRQCAAQGISQAFAASLNLENLLTFELKYIVYRYWYRIGLKAHLQGGKNTTQIDLY